MPPHVATRDLPMLRDEDRTLYPGGLRRAGMT